MDVVHEECGVFGIYNNKEAARLTYLGLQQLQHRGQESAGIVSSDGDRFYTHVSMGLVAAAIRRKYQDSINRADPWAEDLRRWTRSAARAERVRV